MTARPRLAALLCLALAAAAGRPASAQLDAPGAPWVAPSLDDSGWSLAHNPANLSFVRGFFGGALLRGFEDGGLTPSSSWLLGGGAAGVVGGAIGIDAVRGALPYSRLSVGAAAGGPRASFGFATRRTFAPARTGLGAFRSTDLGFTGRARRWLALSAGVRNLTERRIGDLGTDRVWVVGAGLREPRGRIGIDVSWASPLRAREQNGRPTAVPILHGALDVTPTPGLGLWAAAAFSTRDEVALQHVTAGITVAVGGSSFRGGTWYDPDLEGLGGIVGFEVVAPEPPSLLRPTAMLHVELGSEIPERSGVGLFGPRGMAQTDLLLLLDRAVRQPGVAGVFVESDGLASGGAQLVELRDALERVRAAGGHVAMHLHAPTIRDLYLASAADFVTVGPHAAALDLGLASERLYFADLLARFGIEAQFVRIGAFKSGPERFTNSGPSDEASAALDRFLDVFWEVLEAGVRADSARTRDELAAALADAPLLPDELVALGLADATVHAEDLERTLERHYGRAMRWSRTWPSTATPDEFYPRRTIAILHIQGAIVTGSGGIDWLSGGVSTGSDSVRAACRTIAADPSIAGVLVRIDSGGGSAAASDDILRALRELADDVPMVVSMGDVAGSGGYYVAAISEDVPVYATPATLTGSIGIYAGTFAVDDLLARIGIGRFFAERGGASGYFNGRRWDEARLAAMEASIAFAYETFIDRVAEGRGLDSEAVDAVGQGRIWPGVDALEHGLIDGVGGFAEAMETLRAEVRVREGEIVAARHFPARPALGGLAGALLPLLQSAEDGRAPDDEAAARSMVRAWLGDSLAIEVLSALLAGADGEAQARVPWALGGL